MKRGKREKFKKMTGHTEKGEETEDLLKYIRIAYARRVIALTVVSMRRKCWSKGSGYEGFYQRLLHLKDFAAKKADKDQFAAWIEESKKFFLDK